MARGVIHVNSNNGGDLFRADGNVAMHVPDLGEAERFYGRVLGLRLQTRSNTQLVYDAGELTLYINLDDTGTLPFIPAFLVPDLAAAKARLKDAGVEIRKVWGSKSMYIVDPFGTTLDVTESTNTSIDVDGSSVS